MTSHVASARFHRLALLAGLGLTIALCPSTVSAAITVTAIDPSSFTTDITDLFDQAQGATIVATTPLQIGPAAVAIGATGGDAFNSIIFSDSAGINQSFTVRTAASATTIGGFNLYLADDSQTFPTSPDRTYTRVTLLGSIDGVSFSELASTNLGQYFQTYGSRLIRVSGTFDPGAYQFFRFDGVGSNSVGLYGGRVVELDAVAASAAVPEPASWALMVAGFGMLGSVIRRQKAVLSWS